MSACRQILIRRPGPQGPPPTILYPVTSVHGRTGAVVGQAGDYTELTNLRVPGELSIRCPDDGSIHQVTVAKIGTDGDGNPVYQMGIQKLA